VKESLEVLARKYRPKNFDELIGQESISQTLSLALDANRLSHAYLFSGLRGSGKTSTARIFAKALICEKGLTHQPCGVCQNCVMALQNRHIDIIEMDGASSRKIDDIRDLIEQTKYRPAVARFKIFIIDEVHMLTKEAFNALLKTLEEPPSYVKFILATTDPLKLPATILSRTQHFRFKSIPTNKIVDHLIYILNIEGIDHDNEALEILARSGGGSLRDTLTLLDQAIIYSKSHIDVRTVTDMLGLVDPMFIADLFNAIFSKDYATIIKLVKALEDYESEMVVNELIIYLKERMYASDALYSTLVLDRFFRILSDAKYLFSINADGSFVLSLIFFKMIEALRIKEVDQMIESLQKEIHRPVISCIPTELPIKEKLSSNDEEPCDLVPSKTIQEPLLAQNRPDPYIKVFSDLILKIRDRNFELGECFEKSISFISYEDATLTWESCADEECKKVLTHGYGVIKQLVREVFGFGTKIRHEVCTKQEDPLHTDVINERSLTPELKEQEPSSMIEDAEFGGGASCITNCTNSDSSREIDGADIKDEPMVQKAIELFEATKITIQSKI
jgi:DNA polymerase-3 subunit gamma/tau